MNRGKKRVGGGKYVDADETRDDSEYSLVESPASSLFNDPDGDVILRTSDDKDFQVSKAILKFASPVFRTMFSLPQPSIEDSVNPPPLPIIPISEPTITIDLLLRFIYPVRHPDLDCEDVANILDVVLAAKKYGTYSVIGPVREAFEKRVEASKENALAGFALAAHRKLQMETRLAAKACLKWPIGDIFVPELELISGMDYAKLRKYHETTGQAVTDLFTSYDFLTGPCSMGVWNYCICDVRESDSQLTTQGRIEMTQWWGAWSKILISALRKAPLGVEAISLSDLPFVKRKCKICRDTIFAEWETGKDAMIDAITEEVDKVEFKLGWM